MNIFKEYINFVYNRRSELEVGSVRHGIYTFGDGDGSYIIGNDDLDIDFDYNTLKLFYKTHMSTINYRRFIENDDMYFQYLLTDDTNLERNEFNMIDEIYKELNKTR